MLESRGTRVKGRDEMVEDWYAKQYWEEIDAGVWDMPEGCSYCGEDPCICDRIADQQESDYLGMAY